MDQPLTVAEAVAVAQYTIRKEALQTARTQSGLTQRTLAELVGVSQPTWANWERGVHRPSPRYRMRIKAVLDELAAELHRLDHE